MKIILNFFILLLIFFSSSCKDNNINSYKFPAIGDSFIDVQKFHGQPLYIRVLQENAVVYAYEIDSVDNDLGKDHSEAFGGGKLVDVQFNEVSTIWLYVENDLIRAMLIMPGSLFEHDDISFIFKSILRGQ